MSRNYIVVGNDGFPRFADPECNQLYVTKTEEAALDTARDMVRASPFVVFGVYALVANVFSDGMSEVVVHSGDEDKN